jgi:ketosteroid isomerase-like protein
MCKEDIMSTGDHDDIRALLDDWTKALRQKDAASVMACESATIRAFTLAPPLQQSVGDGAELQYWFDTWNGSLEFEIRDTDLRLGGDIAWCSAFAWLGGDKIGQGKVGFWYRLTLAFAREDGRWRIVHTHESVPFAMDGEPLGLFNLKP